MPWYVYVHCTEILMNILRELSLYLFCMIHTYDIHIDIFHLLTAAGFSAKPYEMHLITDRTMKRRIKYYHHLMTWNQTTMTNQFMAILQIITALLIKCP